MHQGFIIIYCAAILYLAYTDLSTGLIPNRIILPAIVIAAVETVIMGTWRSDITGGALALALFVLPILIYGHELAGAGDAKLALFLGLWLGYPTVLSAILVAALAVSLFGFRASLHGGLSRKTTVPMAPFFAFGVLTTMLVFGV